MASLTVKKVSWGEDAFCVHDEIFMQFGKKSGEQANVIKKKLVVWASLFLLSLFFKLEFPLRRITSLHQTPFSSCIYIYNPRNSLYLATSFTRTFFLQVIVTNERTCSWMENQCFDKWNKLIYDVDTLLLKGKKLSEWWLLPFSSSVCSRSQATRRWRSALLR